MPIQQVSAYRVGTMVFPTIQEAQKEELLSILAPEGRVEKDLVLHRTIDQIIQHTDEVVAILTCQPVAKPKKTRSDKGKKRKPKPSSAAVNAANLPS